MTQLHREKTSTDSPSPKGSALSDRYELVTDGLEFPEGPVFLPDGSIVLVEVRRGTLTRVRPDGTIDTRMPLGGGPNGVATGPDGSFYVCNNGGFAWNPSRPYLQPDDYMGGWIERVNADLETTTVLYSSCGSQMLKAPNDIVFDAFGGFYFTDSGKSRERERDYGGIYYAMADGSRISEVAFPMWSPNGIGLSADSNVLYVSETESGRLWAFDIIEPGVFEKHPSTAHGGRLVTGLPGFQKFDGLALDEEGFVYVTTPVTGAITVIGPDGSLVEQQFVPDSDVTNICFGGADRRTLYITLGNTGQLIKTRCQRAGLPLTY